MYTYSLAVWIAFWLFMVHFIHSLVSTQISNTQILFKTQKIYRWQTLKTFKNAVDLMMSRLIKTRILMIQLKSDIKMYLESFFTCMKTQLSDTNFTWDITKALSIISQKSYILILEQPHYRQNYKLLIWAKAMNFHFSKTVGLTFFLFFQNLMAVSLGNPGLLNLFCFSSRIVFHI